uniref:Uncharacterized protein n=1 Tax=Alexandrium monilatum TaxID=311494 RepID=A0A7S4RWA9_9DINO
MGAQGSVPNGNLDQITCHDSRGEAVISWESAKRLEATGLSRITELEEELYEAQAKVSEREEELSRTQRLLVKLEGAIDKQAKDSELEQDRISRMEAALAQQSNGTEEKVAKLLLAVAGERHRAEIAEKALGEARQQAEAEWGEAVAQLRKQLSEEESLLRSAMESIKEKDLVIGDLRQKCVTLEEALESARQAPAEVEPATDAEVAQMVRELQLQLTEEVAKRMEVQNRLLDKDRQLREAKEALSKSSPAQGDAANEDHGAIHQVQQRLAEEEDRRHEAEGKLMEKDNQIHQLQQQLADELKSRMDAQKQVVEKERKLSELKLYIEDGDLTRQQGQQAQVIEKEREVCELQQQLAEELTRRQGIQYQLIEKERQVCSLQSQLMGIGSINHVRTPLMVELPTHTEVNSEDSEPDDEKSPAPNTVRTQPKDVEEIEPEKTFRRLTQDGKGGSAVVPVTAPPNPRSSFGSFAMQTFSNFAPSQLTSGWTSKATNPSEHVIHNYTSSVASPTMSLEPPMASSRPSEAAGASLRNRMYVQRGGYYVQSTGGPGVTTPAGPGYGDRHQRRLILASRTFA